VKVGGEGYHKRIKDISGIDNTMIKTIRCEKHAVGYRKQYFHLAREYRAKW
jgi:hypothetical protein